MQPFVSAMTSLRDVLLAAFRSLLRGRSLLRILLAFWTESKPNHDHQDVGQAKVAASPVADFLADAEHLLLAPVEPSRLRDLSRKLKRQFREALRLNPNCMLPSYNSQLPTGLESGQYLALDVGGSTLRVALVELAGRASQGLRTSIVRIDSFKISSDVRSLRGVAFFDWMAERIRETVAEDGEKGHSPDHPLIIGMAWSFPIEQTSSKGGKLCGMGKDFLAAEGLVGQDLGEIINLACRRKGIHVELCAIVNDSSATLLSKAYTNPSTRFGLILGTGVNIAAHLPVSTIDLPKYGDRPSSWHEKASHVIVNTELGMFGKDILPLTRWDKLLKAAHPRPDFQPLEQLVSGLYLGEICRLALLDAITTTGIFGGTVPPSLQKPYSLDTETLSLIEADSSSSLSTSITLFTSRHPSTVTPTTADLAFLRALASYIARRSAAIVAASLFALWELKAEAERELITDASSSPSFAAAAAEAELALSDAKTTVAYNGSVVENYPGYRDHLQSYIDQLVSISQERRSQDQGQDQGTVARGAEGVIALVEARESPLLGAAVALACLD
ncbi:actin-like ATPase domain-containing protein [Canariomyces notabilis]|uniref:Phosphotransferase n=1 Tax=Canariomyces notabilis TaxID=2074819 RepID=A0AAN6QIL3_9PEZI|nr:actin-like ATPase domain-containing protein [Canariomyces arenarius]